MNLSKNSYFLSVLCLLSLVMSLNPVLATNGDEIDETGCPEVFEKKCKCGTQKYQYWRPDEQVSRDHIENRTRPRLKYS
jgi:hypothetical protein